MTEKEAWKDIEGYEGYYQVSTQGNVRSVDRTVHYVDGRTARYKGKKVAINPRNNGYLKVNLYRDHTMKNISVHRLVAEAFVPNPNNYPCVNHKDESKTNNRVDNLEWCTYKYNSNYGDAIERSAQKQRIPVKGTNVKTGKTIYLKSMTEGEKHGFNQRGISATCLGEQETHYGYTWEKINEGDLVCEL